MPRADSYLPVPPGGLEENFFSLDDILMTQEKIPCRTVMLLPRLGFLDKSNEADLIPEGTKMELPVWMAKGLCDPKRRIISADTPKVYQGGWRTIFSADAKVVDLHKLGPYYYGFGTQLLHFNSPENTEIAQTILQTFVTRFRWIMDSSQNAYNEDTSSLVAHLDELERELFRAGQKGLNEFQKWEKGQAEQITTSNLVQSYGKRKFADMEA
ncbi:DNA replication complex GINS protein PSF3 [Stegostoma tigrinum]|uniref:DNA replication complex GINS protein PSF3 n=1 Tax=Stegostoma tigrinum TaxID=3053191 RepID=UPI00202B83EF|nr:DNA replication complex GINS protein PSF3 [Stegostoma tigrinum]